MSWFAIPALIAGLALGWAHFTTLRRVAEGLIAGQLSVIALQVARFAVLAAFLWLCAKGGALVLLAGAAGVLAARAVVVRRA